MQTASLRLTAADFDRPDFAALRALEPHLVLAFFSMAAVRHERVLRDLAPAFPGARVLGCSTAGEIAQDGVSDDGLVLVALRFAQPGFRAVSAPLPTMEDSQTAGAALAAALKAPGLRSVLLFAPGVAINGSALIDGLAGGVGPGVTITGGLAGDGGAFSQTWTLLDAQLASRQAVAIGLYGDGVQLAHGSFGGWQPFGPVRKVTRAAGNLLYELDGEPALDIYRRYLGDYAKDLPGSGLLFPFAMLGADHRDIGLIRTILGIDEAQGSLVLAGDVEAGGYLRLMHASTNALIEGAEAAAKAAQGMRSDRRSGLAILVSCVGRKLVMGGRVDEEIEAVAEVFGQGATITGFYSNGEISPFVAAQDCRLHNQTMTITYLSE
jgi:hypothetical protein